MLDGIQIDPVAFTIPIGDGFPIYWYGILVTVGIAIGVWWGAREIAKRNQNVDEFFNGLILVIFSGYLFARLTYVTLESFAGRGDQFQTFWDLINIRSGGINILGGFIGAAFVGWLFIRWRGLNFWHYADVAGPAVLIAQAIGRWGNFINQELYGPPTTRPWGILIDAQHRLPQYSDLTQYPLETRFHPTFLYESIWLLLGFIVRWRLTAATATSGGRAHSSGCSSSGGAQAAPCWSSSGPTSRPLATRPLPTPSCWL